MTTEVNKGGRPLATVDYDQLYKLCQLHASWIELAALLGISEDTIAEKLNPESTSYDQKFSECYKSGRAESQAGLRRKQFDLLYGAKSEVVQSTQAIWLGKNILGQSDQLQVHNNTDVNLSITISHDDAPRISAGDKPLEIEGEVVE